MKTLASTLRALSVFALALATVPAAVAASFTWNVASPGLNNWSVNGNWLPNTGNPGSADTAIFGSVGTASAATTINNVVSANTTVSILTYTNTGSTFHVTQIPAGVTLTVSGSFTNGGLIGVSSGISTSDAMTGGGTFQVTGNNFRIGNNNTSGGTASSTLDLSALSNFVYNASGGTFNMGAEGSRSLGSISLATISNYITAGTINVNVNATSTGTSGNFNLGANTNVINAGTLNLSAARNSTPMQFPGGSGAAAGLRLRGTGGTDADRATLVVGNRSTGGTGPSTTLGSILANGHPVDMKMASLTLGKIGNSGTTVGNTGKGVLQFDQGIVDVTTVALGVATGGNSSIGDAAVGELTAGANAQLVIGSGGVSLVNQTTALGTGNLNIFGANAVSSGNIVKTTSAGTGNITMNGGTLNLLTKTIGTAAIPVDALTVTNSAQLILTNTASSPQAFVTSLTLSNSTLHLGVNGAAPFTTNIITTTVTAGPAPSTISIDQIVGFSVGGSPATLPLISYASGSDPFANLTLTPLSGGYSGLLVDNAALKRIDVTITPPGLAAAAVWTGATNGNWDLTTTNWSVSSVPAAYNPASPALFDDTLLSNSTVNVTLALAPPSITVTNNSTNYTFIGTGSLAGPLFKQGSGTLVLDNSGLNTFSSVTLTENGILQVGNNDANGGLGSGPVTNNASLVISRSDNLALANVISGTGSLTKTGNGILTLTAANNYAGRTLVNSGGLAVNGLLNGGGLLTNAAGTVLSGTGSNAGPVEVSGAFNPGNDVGASRVAGTFTALNGFTLDAGATIAFDLNTATTAGGGVNDLLNITNDLNLNNNVLTLGFLSPPTLSTPYRLINYGGALNGAFNATINSHYAVTLDTATPNQVNATFTGSGANLKWNSTASSAWDLGTTANWFNLGSSASDVFYAGDTVLLDDSVANVQTNLTISSGTAIIPASITVNAATNYFIAGGGKISGATGLTKNGAGALSLGTSNDFTGAINIQGGTVIVGNSNALGSWSGGTVTIASGGALDLGNFTNAVNQNNPLFGARQFNVAGTGPSGNGAIVNSSTFNQLGAFQKITLTGNTTFGGPTRWDMRNGTVSLDLAGFKLTKTSPNQISLVSVAVTSGDIDINQGALSFESGSSIPPGGTITVNPGGYLGHFRLNMGALTRQIVLNGGSITNFATSGTTGTNDAPITLTANSALGGSTAAGTSLYLNGGIIEQGGSFGVTKASAGPIVLTGTNTYTGNTLVTLGALALSGSGSLSNSANIIVSPGATFDVSALTLGFVLNANQTLAGGGTNNGSITVGNSSTAVVHPGGGGTTRTTLTFKNNLTFAGAGLANVTLDLSSTFNGANDQIVLSAAGGTLTGNGTIITINSAGTLDTAHDYVLFNVTGGTAVAGTFNATPAWAGTTPKYASRYSIVVSGTQVLLRFAKIPLTVTAVTDTKTYDGTTNSAGTPTLTSGALEPGDTVAWTQAFNNKNAGAGKTLIPRGTVADGNSGNNYTVTFVNDTTGVINARPISVTAVTDTKTYDGSPSSTGLPGLTSGSLAAGDSVVWTQTFDNKNAGTSKTLTPAGTVSDGNGGLNYGVTFVPDGTGVINAKLITVTAAPDSRTYNGTTNSSVAPLISPALVGADTSAFTQAFDTKHAGNGKTLIPAGVANDGNGGNNYAVTFANDLTGSITAKPITVTAATNTKPYDGDTTAAAIPTIAPGLAPGDTANFTETYDTAAVGTGKTLTPAGSVTDGNSGNDYNVTLDTDTTGVINSKALTVTGITAEPKVYDGTNTATISTNGAALVGVVSGDDVVLLTNGYGANFASAGADTNIPVTVTNLTLGGASATNYSLTQPSGLAADITPANLTVTGIIAHDKIFDGTTNATLDTSGAALAGVISSDTGAVTLDTTGALGAFSDANVGNNKLVTITGLTISGAAATNYSLTQPTATANITSAALGVPQILSQQSLGGGSFQLTFTGPNSQTYKVLSSTDVRTAMTNWTTLTSGTFNGSPVTYTDTSATNPAQFYRISSP